MNNGAVYQDAYGVRNTSLAEMARNRVRNPGPGLGGTQCPAAEHLFAVSENGSRTWRNAREDEREELRNEIIAGGQCCQGETGTCPLRG
jgi:hypothetical protein